MNSVSRFFTRLRVFPLLIAAAAATVTGCGTSDERASVEGTVTFDGEPVEQGYLTFLPDGGGPAAGGVIAKGKFTINSERGVVPGANRVEIHATHKTGRMVPGINDPNELVDEWAEMIPPKYHRDSTLKEEIEAGENVIDFVLTSDESKPAL